MQTAADLRRQYQRLAKIGDTYVPFLDGEALLAALIDAQHDADEHEKEMKLLHERLILRDIIVEAAVAWMHDNSDEAADALAQAIITTLDL
jgi:hypothetical protein